SATGPVVNPGMPAEFAAAFEIRFKTVKLIAATLGIKPAQYALNRPVNQPHDRFGCATDVRNREKCKHSSDRPAGDESFEPARNEVGPQTDIGEGYDPAHHKNNEPANDDRKNEPGLAFHCITPSANFGNREVFGG